MTDTAIARPTAERRPKLIVPEVVQTSAMDCGPAALAAVLRGFGVQASYARLREVCQTSVDGTSIDTLEEVAQLLGMRAEQLMLPADLLSLDELQSLPALVVTVDPAGVTHFVVVWSRVGPWVQVMDPAVGRRWMRWETLVEGLLIHEIEVPAEAWRVWAGSAEMLAGLRRRLSDLGMGTVSADALLAPALADPTWRGLAALDEAARVCTLLVSAGGLAPGAEVEGFITAYTTSPQERRLQLAAAHRFVEPCRPGIATEPGDDELLLMRGVVLVRFSGLRGDGEAEAAPLPEALAGVIEGAAPRPGEALLRAVAAEHRLVPITLVLGALVGAAGVLMESLLLQWLAGAAEAALRPAGGGLLFGAILALLAALWALDLLIALGARKYGRRIETRLRIALLERLPRIEARYFQSRLISDLAERAYNLKQLRGLPALGVTIVQTVAQLGLTMAGLVWLNPPGAVVTLAFSVVLAVTLLLAGPLITGASARLRTHSGALSQFYLDALFGLVPARLHGAERSLRREHERLLTTWWSSSTIFSQLGAALGGVWALLYTGLAVTQVALFAAAGGERAQLLLLLYWSLRVPLLAHALVTLLRRSLALRGQLPRLLEPLQAPVSGDAETTPADAESARSAGVSIALEGVAVRAGGHTVLEGVDLRIEPGEHVAMVGPSGAGKTSLAGVLLGWHVPTEGRCLVDGKPLVGPWLAAVRRATAWVDPAVQLWNRPLLDNLRYGGSGSAPDLTRVLLQADLLGVVDRLPAGLQTQLGEGGGLVSGGEGQRVRFGRGLGRAGARLAVLDEPFRGLDRAGRTALLAEARRVWADATLLCITHDVAETRAFPRVLVVEGGQVVEDGAPAQLAALPGSRYSALLAAEERIQSRWAAGLWRRMRVERGRLCESAPSDCR